MDPFAAKIPRLASEVFALCYRAAAGYETRFWPDAAFALTGEQEPWFNVAVVDHGPHPAERAQEIARVFAAKAVPGFVFVADRAADRVAPIAHEVGWQEAGRMPWMVCARADVPSRPIGATYHIELVRDGAALREANRIAARCFGIAPDAVDRVWGPPVLDMLGFRLFLARRADEAVGTVMTTQGGPTVGIWTMATLPERQRQGVGRALLQHVFAYHAGHGAERFYLGATEAGKPLYDRASFRTVTETAIWVADTGGAGH